VRLLGLRHINVNQTSHYKMCRLVVKKNLKKFSTSDFYAAAGKFILPMTRITASCCGLGEIDKGRRSGDGLKLCQRIAAGPECINGFL